MSKLVSEVPPASNLMKKLLHPMNLLDVKIVTVCRVVECSKMSDLIGMSFVVSSSPKQTITQDNKWLGKQQYSLALEPREEYLSEEEFWWKYSLLQREEKNKMICHGPSMKSFD